MSISLLSFSLVELAETLADFKLPNYRIQQIYHALHQKRCRDFSQITTLPQELRQRLSKQFVVSSLQVVTEQVSPDQLTHKWLYQTADNETLESVLIVEQQLTRRTVCLSTMIGCPLGCVFCATGVSGFVRNLSASEMIEQVYQAERECQDLGGLSHLVVMGMGEGLLNLDELLRALGQLSSQNGLNLSRRKITISTSGVVPGIIKLADVAPEYRLALSLHAASQDLRDKLLPGVARWKLTELQAALKYWSQVNRRPFLVEYTLINEVNDSPAEAKKVADFLQSLDCTVNIIPLNPVKEYVGQAPSRNKIWDFAELLRKHNLNVTVRVEKGADIQAACGQLRAK